MKYSFVLPAFKSLYFKQAISSILSQTFSEFELIIVDDCSPEGLNDIISTFNDSRIKYYRNSINIGGWDLVQQWNKSLLLSHGDYIILASDDDVYDSHFLEEMDKLVPKYPSVNVFRPRIYHIDSEGKVIGEDPLFDRTLYNPFEYIKYSESNFLWSGIPQFLFKKDELLKIGGFINFPSAWFSDDATVISLISNGIVVSNKLLYSFRESNINISNMHNTFPLLLKKLNATFMYLNFLEKYIPSIIQSNTKEAIEIASKRPIVLTIWLLKVDDFNTFIRLLMIIAASKNHFFNKMWIFRRFIGFFIHGKKHSMSV